MINFLAAQYNDSWNVTFYYVTVLALLIGIFWTYMQVFVKGNKGNKKPLKENTIYQQTDDVIETGSNYKFKNKNNKKSKNTHK